jgi:1-acyl-sn-glycerol-3-phosphate acyltransferase
LSEFKNGAAILATELDLPIVPVAIDGIYKVWARKSWIIRPAKVKVRYGKPFYAKDILSEPPASVGGKTIDSKYELVTAHLKAQIQTMIDEMRT